MLLLSRLDDMDDVEEFAGEVMERSKGSGEPIGLQLTEFLESS